MIWVAPSERQTAMRGHESKFTGCPLLRMNECILPLTEWNFGLGHARLLRRKLRAPAVLE